MRNWEYFSLWSRSVPDATNTHLIQKNIQVRRYCGFIDGSLEAVLPFRGISIIQFRDHCVTIIIHQYGIISVPPHRASNTNQCNLLNKQKHRSELNTSDLHFLRLISKSQLIVNEILPLWSQWSSIHCAKRKILYFSSDVHRSCIAKKLKFVLDVYICHTRTQYIVEPYANCPLNYSI